LHEYIAHIFVSNGAVFVELYTIYYASTSKLSVLMLLPLYLVFLHKFLYYSIHLICVNISQIVSY
jgi:hypothetical protein